MSLSTALLLLPTVLYGLGLIASAIAAVTKNKTDDEIAAWIVAAHDVLAKLVPGGASLNQKRSTPAPAPEQPPVIRSK
jgi:hypothetical protein